MEVNIMTKEISLFEHNEKAYEALASSLEKNPLAFLEHATGTGKSFILLKLLYMKMRKKRILFISRHYEMFEQLINEQMPALGISIKDFFKFDVEIYPNILKMDMEEVLKNYDCIIWDEAHHCGAPKWSVKVNEAKEIVKRTPGKYMIGATATRIRYLDDYMDVAEEFFDGNVVSVLPVTRAILKNLLPAPSIILTAQECIERIERLQKKLSKIPATPKVVEYQRYLENMKRELIDEFYVGHVLKKYGVKPGEKYIVFCSDINDLKRRMKDAEEWFKDIGPVKMFAAHSGQKRTTNIEQIQSFSKKRDEISLMFAVDIFNEGFHIDGVDGILIFRKTKSPIVYWQQLGRALSFSARRKQIKIFDFANNTSENKIVYQLYKEMLEEARNLIMEDPANKALYEEILSRFQIVDQTTSILEELRDIESKIDTEFIISSRVDMAISKLEEYRAFYPQTDFNDELANDCLSYEYVRAFGYVCDVEDYLSLEQIERIQNLNINFTAKIDLPKKKRLEVLGEHKTFKEMEDKKLESFISSYVDFCNTNNRRPTAADDAELYKTYREYLRILSKSKLNRLLARIPFRLTLEETILLGNYPSRADIYDYLDSIKSKLSQSIALDDIEIRVLKKISHAIPSKDREVLDYLTIYTDTKYQIDEAIAIIRDYKSKISVLDTKIYKKALRIISRLALRVTNDQFAALLELGVPLPSKINMTMEKRLKELDGFDSFYDKKQSEKTRVINAYIRFLKQNKRRPNPNIVREKLLQSNYEEQMFKTTRKKLKELTDILVALRIPLTLEEAVLTRNSVNIDKLDNYILSIRNKLVNNQIITDVELRMLRAIERGAYDTKINVSNFIKMIININDINVMITNYSSHDLNVFQKQNLLRTIFSKSRFFTRKHIERLSELNITIPSEITDYFDSYPNYLNFFEREIEEQEEFWKEFVTYLENHKAYPNEDTMLMQKYRYYLSYASVEIIKKMVNKIRSLGIVVSVEEKIIIQDFTPEEGINYFASIKDKIQRGEIIDPLESRVCRVIDKIIPSKDYDVEIKPAMVSVHNELENKIVRNIRECIRLNPFEPIDLENNYSLSRNSIRRLEIFRINELGKKVLKDILTTIKKHKKPISEVVDEKLQSTLDEIANSADLDGNNEFLLNQVKGLNREYIIMQQGLEAAEFISKYIEFIKCTNGSRPNINSEDEEERALATAYEEVHDLLDARDLQKIEKALKDATVDEDIETFYPRLLSFINEFGRFPCGNSDNPYEVHLNNLFQNLGSTFSKVQSNEIKKLRKIYGRATILANIEFSKKGNIKK